MPNNEKIVPLDRARFDRAAETTRLAFGNDPVIKHLLPPGATEAQWRWYFEMSTRVGLYYGASHITEAAEAVAVWVPPDRKKMGTIEAARCGFYSYPFKLGFQAFLRFGRYIEASEKKHHLYMPEPHWYLLMIGVHPDHQGQGLGSVLIRHALATADRDRRPAYLESSTPQSRALYQRHGFEVLEELVVEPSAPPLWLMRREPHKS